MSEPEYNEHHKGCGSRGGGNQRSNLLKDIPRESKHESWHKLVGNLWFFEAFTVIIRTFVLDETYKRYKISIPKEEARVRCGSCGAVFAMNENLTRPDEAPYFHRPKCKNCGRVCYPINDHAVMTPDQVITTLIKHVFPKSWVPSKKTIAMLESIRKSRTERRRG